MRLTSHTRERIFNALLKLKALAFIELAQEKVTITFEGKQFLGELPVIALRPRTPYAAFFSLLVQTSLAESLRLKRFCRDRFTGARAVTQWGLRNGAQARDIALEVWKGKVAPIIRFRAPTLVLILARLARVYRTRAEAVANVLANWRTQSEALLRKAKKASCLSPNAKLAGLSRLVIFASAVLLIALSTAGGVALLSGKRAESTREALIMSPRESDIIWFYEEQNHPKQSIFVKRNFSGATWIEGISIRGENTSNQSLTAVQAALISDTGEELELAVSTESQQTRADAQDVPSKSEFTLEYGFHPDVSGKQAGMPAEQFLSKYGGMIFKFRYTMPGVQRTLIDYFSPSRLKTELAEAKSGGASQ